ncbi:putative rhamnose biosynthetic enzyme 2-like [Hibiscus syriacus]|uniref:Rhamnose biosynthetic enzyme 2-like n=1 Tax=Hibiscus syriacus TaxID=106335 RepID=A0A6A3BTX9_HIBSY|nr:putative rhamnose biosynthetic enzyme 2-like [Hibiscus syriacus]
MAMVFINKAILMQYTHSMSLITFQQLATALLIHVGRKTGYTKAKGVDITTAKGLLPVSLFSNANVAFALASLKGVNIPIKRLIPLAVLIAGFFSGKGKPTAQVFTLVHFFLYVILIPWGYLNVEIMYPEMIVDALVDVHVDVGYSCRNDFYEWGARF